MDRLVLLRLVTGVLALVAAVEVGDEGAAKLAAALTEQIEG